MTVFIVTGLGFGDEGKGGVVDYLSRQGSAVVVRASGGPQCGHNVLTADGRHHEFSQFGSGTFAGAKTFLSRRMLINPINMWNEADHLIKLGETDIWHRTFVDKDARIITPFHMAVNQAEEKARGDDRHGSCGQGVGAAQRQHLERPDLSIYVRDIDHGLEGKLIELATHLQQDRIEEQCFFLGQTYEQWIRKVNIANSGMLRFMLDGHENVIFEGAQGVLLDEWYGFHPYTTWSTVTHENALDLLDEVSDEKPVRLGVTRAYMTRHGPGPFVTEDPEVNFDEPHNHTGAWQGPFRQGHLDMDALRYSIKVCGGVDQLVVTHLDRASDWKYSVGAYELKQYEKFTSFAQRNTHISERMTPKYRETDSFGLLLDLQDNLDVSVGLVSRGPTADAKFPIPKLSTSVGKI